MQREGGENEGVKKHFTGKIGKKCHTCNTKIDDPSLRKFDPKFGPTEYIKTSSSSAKRKEGKIVKT